MKEAECNFYYLSAREYAEQTGLGYQDVLTQCKKGVFEAFETDGKQWRIKVYKHEAVSRDVHERLKQENTALKTTITAIKNMIVTL